MQPDKMIPLSWTSNGQRHWLRVEVTGARREALAHRQPGLYQLGRLQYLPVNGSRRGGTGIVSHPIATAPVRVTRREHPGPSVFCQAGLIQTAESAVIQYSLRLANSVSAVRSAGHRLRFFIKRFGSFPACQNVMIVFSRSHLRTPRTADDIPNKYEHRRGHDPYVELCALNYELDDRDKEDGK